MANQAPKGERTPRVYALTCNLPHPADRHLSVVLYHMPDGGDGGARWVTWLHNHEDGGDHHGRYFSHEALARQSYATRVLEYMQNYMDGFSPLTGETRQPFTKEED